MTVNDPLAVAPPTSVAITLVPEVPIGTVNVHENVPDPSVVSPPAEQLEIAMLSKTSEASGADTENPVPATVTVAPTGPCPGVTVIAGRVTVKEPLAL